MLEVEVRDPAALKKSYDSYWFPFVLCCFESSRSPKCHSKIIFLFSTATHSSAEPEKNNCSCGAG